MKRNSVLLSIMITVFILVSTFSQSLYSAASETNISVVGEVEATPTPLPTETTQMTPQATPLVDPSATSTPGREVLAADGLMPSLGKISKVTTASRKLSVEYEWDNCYLVLSLNGQYPPDESRDYVNGRYIYYFDEPLKPGTELSITMGRDAEMHVEEKDGKIIELHLGWFSPQSVDTYVGLQKPKVTKVNVKKHIIKGKCYAGSTIKVYFKKAKVGSGKCDKKGSFKIKLNKKGKKLVKKGKKLMFKANCKAGFDNPDIEGEKIEMRTYRSVCTAKFK